MQPSALFIGGMSLEERRPVELGSPRAPMRHASHAPPHSRAERALGALTLLACAALVLLEFDFPNPPGPLSSPLSSTSKRVLLVGGCFICVLSFAKKRDDISLG